GRPTASIISSAWRAMKCSFSKRDDAASHLVNARDAHADAIHAQLAEYANAKHAAHVRIIDTLGALIGGFFGAPCRIARDVAALFPAVEGATVLGTRM